MDKITFSPDPDGFYGIYYPCPSLSQYAMILMIGHSVDNPLVTVMVRWLHRQGCNVLALSSVPEDKGYHCFPLKSVLRAVRWLKKGNDKVGITGASFTGMIALAAASVCPDITLTAAFTPCDFVAEGFIRDGLDHSMERPSGTSSLMWEGKELDYLPYVYRHPDYDRKLKEESGQTGNLVASRNMFDLSEKNSSLTEQQKIKVEQITGTLVLVGAEDDCLWDSCRYIRRMKKRLDSHDHSCRLHCFCYDKGTHFLFPQKMLKMGSGLPALVFRSGRENIMECRKSRIDLERKMTTVIRQWKRI